MNNSQLGETDVTSEYHEVFRLFEKKDYGLVEEKARPLLRRYPYNTSLLHLLGVLYYHTDRRDESIRFITWANACSPGFAEGHNSLANVFLSMNRIEEAIANYKRALALKPDYYDSRMNYSLCLLVKGDYLTGFREHEWRRVNEKLGVFPKWSGQDAGKATVLVEAEQGFGDNIQFARYLRLAAEKCAEVIFWIPDEMERLFTSLPCKVRLVRKLNPDISFNYRCHLMSLPFIFQSTLDTIPRDIPYLFPEPGLVAKHARLFPDDGKLKVGICGRGNPEFAEDRLRSPGLSRFREVVSFPGAGFYCLQKGGSEELYVSGLGEYITDLNPYISDFADTAAMMAHLDLIISSDTAPAHLAGALGRPAWIALPFAADWRWLLNRSDSPWYPSLRLFRQPEFGDWDSVFREIAGQLKSSLKCLPK